MVKPKVIKSVKGGWKPIAIDPTIFNSSALEGFLGIEELTDYSLRGSKTSKKPALKSKKQIVKNNIDQSRLGSDVEENTVNNPSSKESKKRKKKKKVNKAALSSKIQKSSSVSKRDEVDIDKNVKSGNKKPKKKKKNVKKKILKIGQSVESENMLSSPGNGENADEETDSENLTSCMAAWSGLGIPPVLLRALAEKGFVTPTNIQALTLPAAIFGRRDILGAAETGSGKTLAFGLPILNGIEQELLKGTENENDEEEEAADNNINEIEGTIDEIDDENIYDEENVDDDDNDLTDDNENGVSNFNEGESDNSDFEGTLSDNSEADDLDGNPQCIKVIDNVDFNFLIDEKKTSKSHYTLKPLYALILTPTRELAVQISQHLKAAAKYTTISVAVVVGGLAAQKQERVLNRGPEIVVATPGRLWELIEEGHPHLLQVDKLKYLAIDETDRMLEKGHFEELQKILGKINGNDASKEKRQNFVFSATLTLTHEPPRYVVKKNNKKKKLKQDTSRLTPAQKLANIMETVGLTNPKVVDITEGSGVAHLLSEAQIICPMNEKDYYLYYFLQRHPGRTLVFCNSIEAVRRLSQLFTLLGCSPWPLHAKMIQKQRLRNLERFRDNPRGVLLATDVAARGLDIPNVLHVIHYQIPRTAEGYVHRSGRTARAQSEGLTVLFIEPSEVSSFHRLFRTLGRDSDVPTFPFDKDLMPAVKERVNFARRVDKAELQAKRINTEHGWFDKLVKEMDLEVRDDELPTSFSRKSGTKVKKEADVLRKQLAKFISQPLVPKGYSSRFPTQLGNLIVPLLPGSIPPNKESYQETAVEALKHSVEEQRAFKRKLNQERSKRNKKRKRMTSSKGKEEERQPQSDDEGDDMEEGAVEEND